MGTPLIELRSVGKYFNDDFSLQDISLELVPGDVHVLIGQNGSGKTALMNLICGIFRRDAGRDTPRRPRGRFRVRK